MSLPSNDTLIEFSSAISWQEIERAKRQFNRALETLATDSQSDQLLLDDLSEATGMPITSYYDPALHDSGNVLLAKQNGHQFILGSVVSARYRSGHGLLECITPYNLNPSVNHLNIQETEDPNARMRVLGAEIELGLVHADGHSPSEEEMQGYMRAYYNHALRIGIYPRLDREACQYQVEAHIAPSIGYNKARNALTGIMTALAAASAETGLLTAIMSCYPTDSDFKMTDHPKVATAVDLMLEVNDLFPQYADRLAETEARYHINFPGSHYVNMFRIQGCHIHIDLAGRSEALGLLTFHTMLKSATAIANAAVLKGGPFVNGTCDAELLCAREYVRGATVTGRYLDLPISPHLMADGLEKYAALLKLERANAVGRAMLYDDSLGQPISIMHNPVGRVRPDLSTSKRVCTVESTGMPANISASRMAAVLTDFEFSHALMELYFRKHGLDLEPMHEDKTLWAILGPLDHDAFVANHDRSDREGTDTVITTAAGTEMTLAEFYEMKRRYMHRALSNIDEITPRDIDEVYTSLQRMLEPPSGLVAQTVHQFIVDPKLRSTGNWGKILQNAYVEAGGVLGKHSPDAVLKVVNDVHRALATRYLE
ncbi:MAG: Carboxylate-amine ligase YbdK [Chloroflexi bacterium OLB15]|nr:MAG: Carboxylate-amine ligase YbdK [Chloroflexi bacterium OLB15]